MYACEGESIVIVDRLLEEGPDVNTVEKHGRTALMYACAPRGDETQGFVGGNEVIVERLLAAEAKVNVKDIKGRTAYMYACGGRSVPIKDTLVDKGADTNAVDVNERTAKDYTNVGPGGAKKWLDLD